MKLKIIPKDTVVHAPTEDMETKDYPPYLDRPKAVVETPKKELNLCELLKGHEGEYFYSPYLGKCIITELKPYESHNQIWLRTDEDVWCAVPSCGHEPDGAVMLYPSRTLYEQYPLDPYTAWMKWEEDQYKYVLVFNLKTFTKKEINTEIQHPSESAAFCTPADRDKCIEEIKAIIEKYSIK